MKHNSKKQIVRQVSLFKFTSTGKNHFKTKHHFSGRMFILLISFSIFVLKVNAQSSRETADNYLTALKRFEPWAESVWKDYPAIQGTGFFGDGTSGGNGGIRGTSGISLAYAVLIREFPDAPERALRLKRVQASLKFALETHQSGPAGYVAVDGKKWGAFPGIDKKDRRIWQSAMWAGTMGFVAALLEKELDPAVVAGCKRVVAAEADLLATIPPPSGYKIDSKGEENAWDSSIPALAAAWMPNDARAKKWLETAKLYLANSYTVPKDSTGKLKQYITTQTLFPSYAMENHGFYHPSYQAVAGMSMGDTYVMTKFINPTLAKQLEPFTDHNVLPVWNFIKGIILDSGELAYPSGLDWSLHSFEHVSYLAYLSTHFKSPEARWAENKLAEQILLRQAVNGDGQFVGESCPDGFYREGVEAVRIATAYLHHQLSGFQNIKGKPLKNHITNYPDVGLLVQRTDNALITVSYGSKITALVYPINGKSTSENFIISPNTNSLLGGKVKATMLNFQQSSTGFRAQLDMTTAKGAKSIMYIVSNSESVALIEVPYQSANLLPDDWYLMAVENHAFTGGKRNVFWQGDSAFFKERSGTESTKVLSDWINVDNWVGMIAKPKGSFIYKNANKYNRNGAAEDAVIYQIKDKQGPKAVIIIPGKNAASTAAIAKNAKWEITATEVKLSYRTPKGKQTTINVPALHNASVKPESIK